MLATTASPCRRAISISDRWPRCRLPIVGTKATRFASARSCDSSEAVLAICIQSSVKAHSGIGCAVVAVPADQALSEAVLGTRKRSVLHRHRVGRERRLDAVFAGHEIAD